MSCVLTYKYWIKVTIFLVSLLAINILLRDTKLSFTRGNLHGDVRVETGIPWMVMTAIVCKWCDENTSCCALGAVAVSFASLNAKFTMEDH